MGKFRKLLSVVLAVCLVLAYSETASACYWYSYSQPSNTAEQNADIPEIEEGELSVDDVPQEDIVYVDDEAEAPVMKAMLMTGSVEDESLEPLLSNEVYMSTIKAPETVSAKLSEYDAIRISWSAVTGADGYYVYYKKSTASTWNRKTASSRTKTITGLTDGVKYNVKVQAYVEKNNGKIAVGNMRAATSLYTLKKVNQPDVTKYSSSKVTVSWTKISGADGYQISRSLTLAGVNVVSTVSGSVSSSRVTPPTDSRYYYKVRAYAEVDGAKIYAPWSATKSYKL